MIRTEFSAESQFIIPFENVVPREDGIFEYFLSPSLAISFDNLVWISPKGEPLNSNLMDIIKDLDLFDEPMRSLVRRIRHFEKAEEDRIKRYFQRRSRTIFFDKDQAFKLEELFSEFRFVADAEILFNYKPTKLRNLSRADQNRVVEFMEKFNLFYEMTPRDYLEYSNIRKVRKLTSQGKFTNRRIVKMGKTQLMAKMAGGGLLTAMGAILVTAGVQTIKSAIAAYSGEAPEVILVEQEDL